MSLHSKDWMKVGLGAALLAMTGGLAGIGIPGLLGGEAAGLGAAGELGEGASLAAAGAGGSGAAGAAALTAADTAAAATPGTMGFGHALANMGVEAGKDTAKAAMVKGMLDPLTQQKITQYGQLQPPQLIDPMALFPQEVRWS